MIRRTLLAAGAAALLSSAALAHDFWIAASKFRVAVGETVELPLRNGEEYAGSPVRRDNERIERFVVLTPDGVAGIPGADKADPAGKFTPAKDGIYVVGYRSKRRSIELAAAKFEEYLVHEGLEHVAKLRAERKETGKGGREVFSRCAKSLVLAGSAKTGFDAVLGLRLEIVPETNPFAAKPGDELTFRVVFDEKPLEKGLVVARSRAEPKHTVAARTDDKGRVTLKLGSAGEWLVKCVHMVEAPAETGMDWESLWASVTFDIGPR